MEESSLTQAVTQQFLEGFLPPWDKIKDIKANEKIPKGNGKIFGKFPQVSEISVKVEFENVKKRPVHLLVKTPSEDSAGLTRKLKFFHKELFFHDTILREFKKILNNCDSNEKNSLKLSTQPFVSASISDVCDDPLETFIALTDLQQTRKFQIPSLASDGLDFNHCKLAIREIAKLHALSWVYRKSKAVLSLEVLHPVIQETCITNESLESCNLNKPILMMLELPEVQQLFGQDSTKEIKILENLIKNGHEVSDILVKFVNYKGFVGKDIDDELSSDGEDHEWAVGSHGDLRLENLQFRYDPSKNPDEPIEVALVNFNCYRECCPTIDLAYFIYTSANCLTRESQCQELLKIYHDSFMHFCCTLMKKDPYPGFTLDSLTRKFNQAKLFGLLSAICLRVLPTFLQSQGSPQSQCGVVGSKNDDGICDCKIKAWMDSSSTLEEKNSLRGEMSQTFTTDLGKEQLQQRIS